MNSSIKRVDKSWGYELWIANSSDYCGKLLFIEKDKGCSWHYHKLKTETFYIQSGRVLLKYSYDDDYTIAPGIILNKGDKFDVPVLMRHKMIALLDTELFEFSTEHFESDSYRINKV